MSTQIASTAPTSPIEAATIELTQANAAAPIARITASIQNTAIRSVAEFLIQLGLPILPVAPAQDPYQNGQHKQVQGDRPKTWSHCPITKESKPEPLFTGKNPSFLDRNGKPHTVNHRDYQKRLPSAKEIKRWFENPANGIGTLGGRGYVWLDPDSKQFDSQAECDRFFEELLENQPQLRETWLERTQGGGYHIAIKVKETPNFTNFALEPGGAHRGEAIGEGRFVVLAPTIGIAGNPDYHCIHQAVPVEVDSLESIGIFPHSAKAPAAKPTPQLSVVPVTAGSISLEQLGNQAASDILTGNDTESDRSASLTRAYKEWCGWENWAKNNGLAISGSAIDLAHQAGEALGLDADKVDRILKGIDSTQCSPAAQYKGGDEACWKRVRKLDRASFEAIAPPAVRESIEARYAERLGKGKSAGNGGSGGNGGGGNGGDDGSFSENQWNAPVSWQSEIGVWVKDKQTGELRFRPCCNFDFQVVRELTSEDGGGIEIALKRSFDRQEKSIFVESIAYTSPEKFIDAVKKALGAGVVCTLSKSDLSALIHTRMRDYHQRGGKTYRLAERRGRQPDGTWVFENCQFKPDGTLTATEESGWVYTEVFPNCEDVIPSPVIAPYDPTVLQRYLKVKQRAFGRNFEQSLLLDGWVIAGLFGAEIMRKEGAFPLINPYGDPGGFKSIAAESSLSMVGFANGETVLSKVSESALFEWLKRLGSLPVFLDDPKREVGAMDIEEVVKRVYNRFPRVVRGNRQEPQGGMGVTSNHAIGEKNSATQSRLLPLFFSVLSEGSYEKDAFPELIDIRSALSGCFPDLLRLGYDAQAVKQLETEFQRHLPAAHARTAKSLAIVSHYAMEVIRLAGMEAQINFKQWVLEVVCPLCNESQAGLNSVADFAEHLDVLQSRSLVGEWCMTAVETDKYGSCMAIHLPTVWNVFDREFQPAYNRSVLEQVLIQRGAIKNQVAKFWADRDQTLAYKRQQIVVGNSENLPKEPEKVARKCLLIPWEIWNTLFAGHDPSPPDPDLTPPLEHSVSYQPVTPVTSSYQAQVTDPNDSTASVLALENNVSYLVTLDQENQGKRESDPAESIAPTNSVEPKTEVSQIEVTEVTGDFGSAETVAVSKVEVVTSEKLLEVTEAGQQVTDPQPEQTTEKAVSEQAMVTQAVRAMGTVQCLRSFEQFYDTYQPLPESQRQQIWAAASPHSRQQYDHWFTQFQAVPQSVWEAREALRRTYTMGDLKAVRNRFDSETLKAASNLLSKEIKKHIKKLFDAMEKERS